MGAKFFYRDIDLIYFINNQLISNNLINQKDRVLLSFSGGQDSICFVYILNQLYCQLQLDITFFWCHHLWQTDSFYLMQQIAKLSFFFQFNSCFTIPLNNISSEFLAHKWRQSCSYRISLFYNYSKICLAHTFNDKVENIFLNFMRGTGLIGLAPLRWLQFISKPNISSEKYTSRYNYLSLKLNEPNICIPSIKKNSDKLKNLTKEIIRKFMQKSFAVQKIANSTNFTSTNRKFVRIFVRRFVCVGSSYKFSYKSSICTCKLPFVRFIRQVLPQYSVTQLRKPVGVKLKLRKPLPLCLLRKEYAKGTGVKLRKPIGVNVLANRSFANPLHTPYGVSTKIRDLLHKSEIYNSWQSKEGLLLKSLPHTQRVRGTQSKAEVRNQKQRGTALLLLYKSKIYTICKKQRKYFLQQHVPRMGVNLFLQQQEGFIEEDSTNLLYKLFCIAKEPRKDLYSKPLTLMPNKGFALHAKPGVNKNLSKIWSKQLINGCYIVRPLLSISRIELSKICYFWELPIYPDVTNQKVKFLRNRVRRQLLPTIKVFFNLNIENIFSQLATIVETEDYCLTQLMNEFTRNIGVYHTKLDRHILKKKK